MGRYILGLHSGHNASACIGDESGLIYAIQEERLTGEKNYWGTPKNAIRACLRRVGATPADLVAVAHGSIAAICKYHSRDDVLRAYGRQKSLLGKFRQRIAVPLFIKLRPNWGQDRLRADLAAVGLGNVETTYHDHHACHAATAYYGLRCITVGKIPRTHLRRRRRRALHFGPRHGGWRRPRCRHDSVGQFARRTVFLDHLWHGLRAAGA